MQTKTFFELLIATLARLFASIHCRTSFESKAKEHIQHDK